MAQSSTQQLPSRLSSSKGAFALPSSSGSSSPSPSPTHVPGSSHHFPTNHNHTRSDDDDDLDDDDDDQPLPFPAALARSDFLSPDFDPAAYLSSLVAAHRHQTLEDLRSDLRDRSAAISVELLELVNANYTAFLSLGSELRGGEERVEDVRVSLLGFRRAIEEIKGRVRERGREVTGLNGELLEVRRDIERGRLMVELDERVAEIEGRLALGSDPAKRSRGLGGVVDSDDEDFDEDEESETDDDAAAAGGRLGGQIGKGSSPAKLSDLAHAYAVVDELADEIGRDTAFVRKMDERMIRCRNTILLDLNTALKEAKGKAKAERQKAGSGRRSDTARLLKLMNIYNVLDAQGEAVKALKGA
ncbi:oligomeric golgi complex component, COG2-domain-containing protein [Microdochium bolleyi]|uniref:Conserved oligomeric Golgi complex subunit 2 n=1 Tax=Microdochium bolleyi TaxID=196109 RepID=A0A136J8K1_9PEZI|nr:oligomeric golgi complex component, COG2-domain-containing protein [Microdochium bolleyi]